MDTYRAFIAIIISFVILLGYQYLFVGFDQEVVPKDPEVQQTSPQEQTEPAPTVTPQQQVAPQVPEVVEQQVKAYSRTPREIKVETPLYDAIISEDGGVISSFLLKNYKESNDAESPEMQLVKTDASQGFPLQFSWGSALGSKILYTSEKQDVKLTDRGEKTELRMTSEAENGLIVERVYSFEADSYLIGLSVIVKNQTGGLLQGIPQLSLVNSRFAGVSSPAKRFLFGGAAAVINGELHQVKAAEYEEGPKTLQGTIEWAGYEGNYFICAVMPNGEGATSFSMEGTEELTKTHIKGDLETLQTGAENSYSYQLFYGPKKLKMLKEIGHNLDRSVNFGWFDVIAKPTLWLLNMFYSVVHNYGIAIILVTILMKSAFWPISQKGMKSMKNMQKLQPKMAKIKEKYKSDPTKMNQEVMALYKTYKVNPLGGCLPMVLQIPVFFALYKVLLLSIELRHAPFMLWITDLSAPDRLWLGFDIPYVGGLPVLTLLMGASMFFQQRLTPTTADPTQAKIMMFLPIIFTFMFLNFASGLVLYWFINNLLSILQQVLINRQTKKPVTAT